QSSCGSRGFGSGERPSPLPRLFGRARKPRSTEAGVLPIRVRQARVGRHLAAGCPLSLVHGGRAERCAPCFFVVLTRFHADIDAAVWRRDYDEIRAALLAAGWRHTPLETDVVGTRYIWQRSELELTSREDREGAGVGAI